MNQNKKKYLSPVVTTFRMDGNDVISTSFINHDNTGSGDNYYNDPFGQ